MLQEHFRKAVEHKVDDDTCPHDGPLMQHLACSPVWRPPLLPRICGMAKTSLPSRVPGPQVERLLRWRNASCLCRRVRWMSRTPGLASVLWHERCISRAATALTLDRCRTRYSGRGCSRTAESQRGDLGALLEQQVGEKARGADRIDKNHYRCVNLEQ